MEVVKPFLVHRILEALHTLTPLALRQIADDEWVQERQVGILLEEWHKIREPNQLELRVQILQRIQEPIDLKISIR